MVFKMKGWSAFKQTEKPKEFKACTPPAEGCPEGKEWNSVSCSCEDKQKGLSTYRKDQPKHYHTKRPKKD